MGEFESAVRQLFPTCPHCWNDRDLERRGPFWFCPVCSRESPAMTENDKRWLRSVRIAADA